MSEIQSLLNRGKEAFEQRDYAAALVDFQEVLRRNPRFADIRHLTGLCLSFLGYPDAALQEFNEAIALNGSYIEAHINRAITLNELGRFEEAQHAFEQAAEFETATAGGFSAAVSARLANSHAQLGELYVAAGAPAEAAAQFRAALSLRPHFHDIRNRLAEALMQQGELTAAAVELQTILQMNPRFFSARLNLGLIYFRNGDRGGAAREWHIAREQQPGNAQVRAYLGLLDREEPTTGTTL